MHPGLPVSSEAVELVADIWTQAFILRPDPDNDGPGDIWIEGYSPGLAPITLHWQDGARSDWNVLGPGQSGADRVIRRDPGVDPGIR